MLGKTAEASVPNGGELLAKLLKSLVALGITPVWDTQAGVSPVGPQQGLVGDSDW